METPSKSQVEDAAEILDNTYNAEAEAVKLNTHSPKARCVELTDSRWDGAAIDRIEGKRLIEETGCVITAVREEDDGTVRVWLNEIVSLTTSQ